MLLLLDAKDLRYFGHVADVEVGEAVSSEVMSSDEMKIDTRGDWVERGREGEGPKHWLDGHTLGERCLGGEETTTPGGREKHRPAAHTIDFELV